MLRFLSALGSQKRPLEVRVQTEERASEIASICTEHSWHYIIGFEPNKPEDVSDFEKLLNPPKPVKALAIDGRSELPPPKVVVVHSEKRNLDCFR